MRARRSQFTGIMRGRGAEERPRRPDMRRSAVRAVREPRHRLTRRARKQ